MSKVNTTLTTAIVLRQFLNDPAAPRYGFDLIQATGLKSGSLYPILARLAHAGWLTREREDINPSEAGRPPRRFYKLTPEGEREATSRLNALTVQLGGEDVGRSGGA